MDESYSRVRFQQIPTYPLAGIRLARAPRRPDPIAYAVDDGDSPVVQLGQFVRTGVCPKLHARRTRPLDRDADRFVLAGERVDRARRTAVLANRDGDDARTVVGGRQVVDADGDFHLLTDDAEARRAHQLQRDRKSVV